MESSATSGSQPNSSASNSGTAQAGKNLSLAGGVFGALGTLIQGQAAEDAGKYNAEVARQNATLARQKAFEEARRIRVAGRKQIGDMRASYGHSGLGIQGSAIDVLMESAANVELDALTKENEGETRARMFESEAEMELFGGDMAKTSSYLSASGKLMESAGKATGRS